MEAEQGREEEPLDRAGEDRVEVHPALERLLRLLAREKATDLHLKVGSPPLVRIAGTLCPVEAPVLESGAVERLLAGVITGVRRERLETRGDVDFAWSIEGLGRFRFHVFRQRGSVSAAIRRVETEIPDFASLRLPAAVLERIARLRRGLVLVCGSTGSGKSTTLAAMIACINALRRCHIVTIEDPIEYLHADAKACINQREVGIDVPDFPTAVRAVLRQDPDVILIGEMRDPETFEAAIAAAETGHLVFTTLHSADATATISRVVDLFPPERERQVRNALRQHLRAVICQKLLPARDRAIRRVPAVELLLVNAEARKAIGEGEDDRIPAILRAGRDEGMLEFNHSLLELVQRGLVEREVALAASPNPHQLEMQLKGIHLAEDRGFVR